MVNNNNRNSRDDKSKTGDSGKSRRPTGTGQSKPKFGKDGKDQGGFEPREDRKKAGYGTGEKREYKPRASKDGDSKPYSSKSGKDFKPRTPRDGDSKPYSARPNADRDSKARTPRDGDSRPYTAKPNADRDFKPRGEGNQKTSFKPWEKKESGNAGYKPRAFKEGSSKEESTENKRSYTKKDNYAKDDNKSRFADKKSGTSRSTDNRPYRKREDGNFKSAERGERVAPVTRARKTQEPKDDGLIRLNRYIANSGICSRRKADELIEAGVVSVNGVPVSELGHKVDPYKDEVRYNGELLKREKRVYVLLNKPKDYITTTDDPQERKTVMQLVDKASRERIYPVGRLDRNTTGLILMTNDGDLADKLSHPKNGITKIYHVELSKSLSQGDFNKIQFGLELEDGLIKPDNISYVTGASKKEIGIQIHSGKNRIVRRIFEHLGYDVVKLDRVVYGNLTKKDLPRGKWRFLEEHELIQIKHLIK
jgi:23S rRNA pseudouridine2605 synthase